MLQVQSVIFMSRLRPVAGSGWTTRVMNSRWTASAVIPYGRVIRSCSQELMSLSAVPAIVVGWLVKPWGVSG